MSDVEKAAWPVVFDATPLTVFALRPGDFVTVSSGGTGRAASPPSST